MARRPAGSDPAYRLHKPSGRAVVSLPNGDGTYSDIYLGTHGTEESRREYDRVLAEWKANRARAASAAGVSVAELLDAFLAHAEIYYRKGEARTSEYDNFVYALRPVLHLYADLAAGEFRPHHLKAVRQLMVAGYQHPRHGEQSGLARTVVNGRVRRIVHVWRWAVGEELVAPEILVALRAVEPLKRGRSAARETKPVEAVPVELVEATLPHLPPPVAAMVRLQLLTGMRPGEVVQMRAGDIDRDGGRSGVAGELWAYTPGRHKTEHHGRRRVVVLGPRAQDLLAPWLEKAEADGLPVFSPARDREERFARLRAARRSRVQPSQKSRRKSKPKRKPGTAFTTNSYSAAVRRACKKHRLTVWHVHQLRHTHAETVRQHFASLDHVQAALGHATQAMAERYAPLDLTFSSDVAKEIG